jgi:NCAIR mutase (PurE)-related protein
VRQQHPHLKTEAGIAEELAVLVLNGESTKIKLTAGETRRIRQTFLDALSADAKKEKFSTMSLTGRIDPNPSELSTRASEYMQKRMQKLIPETLVRERARLKARDEELKRERKQKARPAKKTA